MRMTEAVKAAREKMRRREKKAKREEKKIAKEVKAEEGGECRRKTRMDEGKRRG